MKLKASQKRVIDVLKRGGSLIAPSGIDAKSYLLCDPNRRNEEIWVRESTVDEMLGDLNLLTREHLTAPITLVPPCPGCEYDRIVPCLACNGDRPRACGECSNGWVPCEECNSGGRNE